MKAYLSKPCGNDGSSPTWWRWAKVNQLRDALDDPLMFFGESPINGLVEGKIYTRAIDFPIQHGAFRFQSSLKPIHWTNQSWNSLSWGGSLRLVSVGRGLPDRHNVGLLGKGSGGVSSVGRPRSNKQRVADRVHQGMALLPLIHWLYMEVSWTRGTPKSSILIRFSIINQPFWDTYPPFMETSR